MSQSPLATLILVSLCASACGAIPDPLRKPGYGAVAGESNRLWFDAGNRSPLQSWAARARGFVYVDDLGADYGVRRAVSSDPNVIAVQSGGAGGIEFLTNDPGSARIALLDQNDAEIDAITLTVEAVGRLIPKGDAGTDPIILAGWAGRLTVDVEGASGSPLLGTKIVTFAMTGSLRDAEEYMPYGETQAFNVGEEGGTITARAGEAEAHMTVHIAQASDVATIELDEPKLGEYHFEDSSGRPMASISYRAKNAAGDFIYGAKCAWTVPTNFQPVRDDVMSSTADDRRDGNVARLFLPADHGNYPVSCLIGTVTASATIVYQ